MQTILLTFSSILICSTQAKRGSILGKVILVSLRCTSSNPRTSKIQKSMSQNDDPKMAISIGISSIEGPDVGFRRGG